ncbi:unnamed protein product [Cylicocyclus nassatus]|uniref:Uncharacterized protein n=1 Tax=Cylicocyclus nassatus TaxID=53992 RepID=A0AA36GSQ1_CYLNA|nr:unnamed protein product [Cylicocyclus nassatus]
MKKTEEKDLGIVVGRDFQNCIIDPNWSSTCSYANPLRLVLTTVPSDDQLGSIIQCFQKPNVAKVSLRKRPQPSEDITDPSAAPHVIHEIEILTVIIPKRRVAILKNDAAAQSTTCTYPYSKGNKWNDTKGEDSRGAVLPDLLPSNLPSNEKVDTLAVDQQKPIANDNDVTSKEEIQLDSDTDIDDDLKEEMRTIPDPPFKCKISDKNIIPFSSEEYVFLNPLFMPGIYSRTALPSIEEFYMSGKTSALTCVSPKKTNSFPHRKNAPAQLRGHRSGPGPDQG